MLYQWPGYSPAFIDLQIPTGCSRQDFAQIVAKEVIVWATLLTVRLSRDLEPEEDHAIVLMP